MLKLKLKVLIYLLKNNCNIYWYYFGKILWKNVMATHSSILAWRTHGQRSPGGYSPWGHRQLDTTEWLTLTNLCVTVLYFPSLL